MVLASINPFEHVLDTRHWNFFESVRIGFDIRAPFSKFIILQLIAAGLMFAVFVPLGRRIRDGRLPTSKLGRVVMGMLEWVRDEIAIPGVGEHDANRFLPFLWSVFFYIFVCNLLGMVPFLGSPTGSIWVTAALALCAFTVIHGSAIIKTGPTHYLKAHFPHVEAPFPLGPIIAFFIAGIEIMGHFIKAFVLAVRLFANIFAGHTVLAVILMLIVMAKYAPGYMFWPISFGSVLAVTALSFLELFIAFLQAYVFAFLTSIFLGMALHPEH
ncbi:MAG TPA: F0F1 ATP synthase subunit A [Gemmataceae bacterium]|nr:F0F1 ATP synthase subunit A [Gemmataceae bacterium]